MPERIGGMDHFFWLFDQKAKQQNVHIDWFFPNAATHGSYAELTIIASDFENVEHYFLKYTAQHATNYTTIYTHFVELCSPVFKEIKQLTQAKIIAVDHNPRPIGGYSFRKKIEKKVKGFLYSRYIDQFVCVSKKTKRQCIQDFGFLIKRKTSVVFNGLPVASFQQKTSFTSFTSFVIASHLRKEKGIQDVIAAVRLVTKYVSVPFTITIYGEGYYESELKKQIAAAGLDAYFIFKGSVQNLAELYQDYDYLIHPSHGETFCYTVVEGLLCNLPVITTKKQGNVLGLVHPNQNGFLYKAGDYHGLKNILIAILTQKIKIENGLQKQPNVQQLSLESMVHNYLKLLS